MARTGVATKERILEEARALVFNHGLSGTSIDMIIQRAGVTKGAFFHHYKSKGVLAEALIDEAAQQDLALMRSSMERAESLSSDPLQQALIYVGLIREMIDSLDAPPPGCMFASMIYQKLEVPFDMQSTARHTFYAWRDTLARKLEQAKQLHPPVKDFNADDLADYFTTVFEGALIMYRLYDDATHLTKSLDHYRDLISGYFGTLADTP